MEAEAPTCPKCGTPFMAKAPIYDDHVERCNGPAVVKFTVTRLQGDRGHSPFLDTYEEAETKARHYASIYSDTFEVRKVYTRANE